MSYMSRFEMLFYTMETWKDHNDSSFVFGSCMDYGIAEASQYIYGNAPNFRITFLHGADCDGFR